MARYQAIDNVQKLIVFLYTSNELLEFHIKNKQANFYNCTRNRKFSGTKLKKLSTASK